MTVGEAKAAQARVVELLRRLGESFEELTLADVRAYRDAGVEISTLSAEAHDEAGRLAGQIAARTGHTDLPLVEVATADELARYDSILARVLHLERADAALEAWAQRADAALQPPPELRLACPDEFHIGVTVMEEIVPPESEGPR